MRRDLTADRSRCQGTSSHPEPCDEGNAHRKCFLILSFGLDDSECTILLIWMCNEMKADDLKSEGR